jgi:transcription antitermination factor NusG
MRWHVALVRSGTEDRALRSLVTAGFQTIWPRWVETYVSYNQKRERYCSLASGYLLTRFDGNDAVAWHDVRELCSGYGFIGGESPDPVRDEKVDEFLNGRVVNGRKVGGCLTADGLMVAPGSYVGEGLRKAGEVVKLYGLWSGQKGTVKWDDNRGVKVVLEMMGRETDLYLAYPEALELEVVRGYEKKFSPYGTRHTRTTANPAYA